MIDTHKSKTIQCIEEFIQLIRGDASTFEYMWFRGEPQTDTPLLPKLYRSEKDGRIHHENKLIQNFRMRAPTFYSGPMPDRDEIDKWLFLAQHHGLPTRLLDWSESALIGLYFALQMENPILWVLDPIALNRKAEIQIPSLRTENFKGVVEGDDQFPLTWCHPDERYLEVEEGHWENVTVYNIGFLNFQGAWGHDRVGTNLPVAVRPTNTHPRMSAQRSCFTIHGKKKQSLLDLAPEFLTRYLIPQSCIKQMRCDLRVLGVDHATVFPDLSALAQELADVY